MSERPKAVFLERQTYRRRRLIDWLCILPLVGLGLWCIPLLWEKGAGSAVSTADAIIFVFGVWLVLVVLSALSARTLRIAEEADQDGQSKGDS